jgi:hypothetical protein
LICVTMAMKSRFYRVCGQPFRPVRFDALTLAPQDAQEPQGRSRLPDDLAAGSSASPAHDPGTAGKAVARPRGWRACPGPSVRRAKLQETKAELRQRMHQTIPDQGHCLRQVVTRQLAFAVNQWPAPPRPDERWWNLVGARGLMVGASSCGFSSRPYSNVGGVVSLRRLQGTDR